MTVRRFFAGPARFLLSLAVLVFLLATNVLLVANPAFVAHEYRQPRVPGSERYDPPVRLQLSQATVRWLNSSQPIEDLAALEEGGQPVYNERELQHMADVKVVMGGLRWAWRIAGLLLLGALAAALWRPGWREPVARGTLLGSGLLLAVLAGILLSALLSFDTFFTFFHQVFFAADTWMFPYEDSLIQFYPLQFWIDITWVLGVASVVEGLLVGAASYACLRAGGKGQGQPARRRSR